MTVLSNIKRPILPGATLGVMGGGQLGRMFVHAAQQMGYFTAVLDDAADSPAGCVSHRHIRSSYMDEKGLQQLWQSCAAVTTEFENVPAQALRLLSAQVAISPHADAISIAQDRALEKVLFTQSGVGCAQHAVINTIKDVSAVDEALFPAILKTSRLGYDGKGQASVASKANLQEIWESLGQVPCVLEKKMPLAAEVSVLVARGHDGQCVHFPVQYNLHREGILAVTEVPLPQDHTPHATLQVQAQQAVMAAKRLTQTLNYVGVLCVEFFILKDGSLIANEIAPRPHNSAHWTMNGCSYSQFEAQVRTLTGLPLCEPVQHSCAIMLNLLGDLWFDEQGQQVTPLWEEVLALSGIHLHLYGKTQAKKGRKMGHLNITASDFKKAKKVALKAATLLNIAPW